MVGRPRVVQEGDRRRDAGDPLAQEQRHRRGVERQPGQLLVRDCWASAVFSRARGRVVDRDRLVHDLRRTRGRPGAVVAELAGAQHAVQLQRVGAREVPASEEQVDALARGSGRRTAPCSVRGDRLDRRLQSDRLRRRGRRLRDHVEVAADRGGRRCTISSPATPASSASCLAASTSYGYSSGRRTRVGDAAVARRRPRPIRS